MFYFGCELIPTADPFHTLDQIAGKYLERDVEQRGAIKFKNLLPGGIEFLAAAKREQKQIRPVIEKEGGCDGARCTKAGTGRIPGFAFASTCMNVFAVKQSPKLKRF